MELRGGSGVSTPVRPATLALVLAACAAAPPSSTHPSEVPGTTPPTVSRTETIEIARAEPTREQPGAMPAADVPTGEPRPAAPLPALSTAMLAPRVAGADAALFAEMVQPADAGGDARSKSAMLQLVRDHPRSVLVPYAFAHLGDRLFARGDLPGARASYEKVLHFADAEVVGYARYRLGWCALLERPADATAALESFAQAIATGSGGAQPHSSHARTLRRAARLDLVTAFVEVGKSAKAAAFFDRLGRGPGGEDDRADMLRALAAAYLGAGRRDDALIVCTALLERDLGEGRGCP